MRSAWLKKRVVQLPLFLFLILVTGCDPGFTVRQVAVQSRRQSALPMVLPQVSLTVSKFHRLAGYSSYNPNIQVRNLANEPISVTGVDLAIKRGAYLLSSLHREAFAVSIDPGATREIGAWFELPEDLEKAFKKPAELRVHYTIGNTSGMAITRLVGRLGAGGQP